jgi:Zn finger protein HypA/HybF involved in hydrogenase expression
MPEKQITVKGFYCFRCNHEWIPNNAEIKPLVCPKCHTPYWDREKKLRKKR